jgi:anaerobic nitric oxide reductase transcription regulator
MLAPLLEVASDLSADLVPEERYRRLLSAARRVIPCDAVTLLELDHGSLVPIAMDGLRPEARARTYTPSEHPRLAQILSAHGPVSFHDPDLPDPFDGLFAGRDDTHAHACTGCPLIVGGEVVGALALDAVAPHAFDEVEHDTIAMLGAMAGATLHAATIATALDEREHSPRERVARDRARDELIGTTAPMLRLRAELELVARSSLTVLITGETGVGKELVARHIHATSPRASAPMVHVNCAALPETLAESELFGHVRGAFTGAIDHRAGKFEVAHRGTLFLDEIGELPLSIQPKLLRALQSGEVHRVGSDRALHVDVRIIAATNRDLVEEVRAGRFRADLFHRLSVYPLSVPALRDRVDDIPLLSAHILDRCRQQLGAGPLRLGAAASERLREHAWPGNVRELEHLLTRGALRASAGRPGAPAEIDIPHLDLACATCEDAAPRGLRDEVDAFTRRLITRTVAECRGNWAEAARRLDLQRGNLHRLATRLGLR